MSVSDDPQFLRQVRDALAHLYDYAYLQRHPLAERLASPQATATRTRGQELRRILLDAIEALNPGDSVPMRAVERRPYAILFDLYVEGRPQPEVANSLGIGGRQLRRDRAAAFQALAGLLRDRYLPAAPAQGGQEPLRQESARLAMRREPLDPKALVAGLLPLLEAMARERGVELLSHVGPGLPQPAVNRTLMRQVLIGLASQALTTLPLARLSFEARSSATAVGIGLGLEYRETDAATDEGALAPRLASQLKPVETLVTALGGRLLHEAPSNEAERVWVLLPLQEETVVLVVDDNRELYALFERYVAGQPYRLVHAAGADEALSLARSVRPHIITVDLMMPSRDGWELLQALRTGPGTAHIPAIVCSILEEPELALSLGAQAYLKKPVGQADLLQALEAVKAQAWAGEAHRGSPAGR